MVLFHYHFTSLYFRAACALLSIVGCLAEFTFLFLQPIILLGNCFPTFSYLADLLEVIHLVLQLMDKLQARGTLRVCCRPFFELLDGL